MVAVILTVVETVAFVFGPNKVGGCSQDELQL